MEIVMSVENVPENASNLVEALLGAATWSRVHCAGISHLPQTKIILEADLHSQVAVLRECFDRIAKVRDELGDPESNQNHYWNIHHHPIFPYPALLLIELLFRRKLPYSNEDFTYLCNRISDLEIILLHSLPFVSKLVRLLEQHAESNPLPIELQTALKRLHGAIAEVTNVPECKMRERIHYLLTKQAESAPMNLSNLQNGSKPDQNQWGRLFKHCASATSATPSKSWNENAKFLAEAIGPETLTRSLLEWFSLVPNSRDHEANRIHRWQFSDASSGRHDVDDNTLRGLIWLTPLVDQTQFPRTLASLVETSLKKLPGVGPRWPKIANAAIYALGSIESADALGQLARLKVRVRFGTALKQIEKALNTTAERLKITREDLEELGVPTYGFSPDGLRTETLGDCRVELRISGTDIRTTWFNAKNKQVKAVPAEIKSDHAETLKEIKGAALDAAAMLTAQRSRLDNLMISTKAWSITDFRTRYLDHPISGAIARKLVWLVDGIPALFQNGHALDVDGKPITHGQTADITIWHPALRPTAEILAWRTRLETLQITQPFKQAHREIYLLTDAERNTRTYSNRFAAHIIKQHQFNALATARGWKSKLRLMVDDTYTAPCKILPQFNLRAEFWVEGSGDQYGADTNDTGVYLRLATDQVRFYPSAAAQPSAHASGGGYGEGYRQPLATEPLPLDQVPALAFSEIMRDVDLFVGVCSIANDPNWTDGAHTAAQNNYWQSQSFGALSVTGQTRKSVLESLLPRLAIAPQCALADKFLLVKGTKRTYKIHLGSGNILMEPNDQYPVSYTHLTLPTKRIV